MSDIKLRVALENSKTLFAGFLASPDEVFAKACEAYFEQVDDALKSEPEMETVTYIEAFARACNQFKASQGIMKEISELPERIKEQSLKIADLAQKVEEKRKAIALKKNDVLELMLSIKEGDKPKFSNDKARSIAQERMLSEDKLFLENCDALGRLEYQLKVEQIELEHLHNLFSAYKSIANMG